MRLKAYSKVNLCLKVFKKENESKHKIDSVFYLYKKISDTILIRKAKQLDIIYKFKNKKQQINDCIVEKSLKYLYEKYDIDVRYKIVIHKHIPIGSGLGGGSSDAAAVINYLISGKNISLDYNEIAMQLGSDIPFFLSGYSIARVRNYGDVISPIYNWKPQIKVFNYPVQSLSQLIFKLLDEDKTYQSKVDVDGFINHYLYKQDYKNLVYNDLTKYIINSNNELRRCYGLHTGLAFFTGSGSSIVKIKE